MKSLSWLAWPALCMSLALTPALAADAPSAATQQSTSAATPEEADIDAAAQEMLNRMAETLAKARGFSVTIRSTYDVVQENGEKIEFGERRTLTLSRPSALRVESLGSDGKSTQVSFDGQAITVFSPVENAYARVDKTGSVDDAVRHLVQDLRVRLPLALLLVSTLPEELQARIEALDYVERDGLTPVPSDHLAGRTEDIDFQVWVAAQDPPLPQRIIITYKADEGEPQFRADFSDWRLNPDIAPAQLALRLPEGAERIPFLVRVPRAAGKAPDDTTQGTSGTSGSTEGAPK